MLSLLSLYGLVNNLEISSLRFSTQYENHQPRTAPPLLALASAFWLVSTPKAARRDSAARNCRTSLPAYSSMKLIHSVKLAPLNHHE